MDAIGYISPNGIHVHQQPLAGQMDFGLCILNSNDRHKLPRHLLSPLPLSLSHTRSHSALVSQAKKFVVLIFNAYKFIGMLPDRGSVCVCVCVSVSVSRVRVVGRRFSNSHKARPAEHSAWPPVSVRSVAGPDACTLNTPAERECPLLAFGRRSTCQHRLVIEAFAFVARIAFFHNGKWGFR